jgi:hypothetical protein
MHKSFKALFATLWRHQWAVVGILACCAFLLALKGLYDLKGGQDWSWPEAIYFALRLYGFNYDLGGEPGDPYAGGNWQLWVASFLAPASTGLAIAKAVATWTAARIDDWHISHLKDHAIICGAGERGRHLALSLRKQKNRRVVMVDHKEAPETLTALRAEGVLAIKGNITAPETLITAGIDKANLVVALTPSMEANLEVVLTASQRMKAKDGKALAYAPRAFATMFEGQTPFKGHASDPKTPRVECGFFDHNATAARVLVNKYTPGLGATLFREQRGARILLAGDGEFLPELLGVLIAQCQFAGSHLPHITLLTDDENAIARGFPLYHPQLSLVVDLLKTIMPMARMLGVSMTQLNTNPNMRPFDLLFIACREDGDTLTLATNLAQQASPAQSVIAGLTPSTRLDQKFDRYFSTPQPLEGVTLYNLLTLGCEERDVVRHELDRKAKDIHRQYFEERRKEGGKPGDSLAMHLWEDLRGDFRESNRSAADHVAVKVRILRLSDSQETIELLAEAEHRRWMAERIVSGWRHATSRNDQKRLHHNFVPYAALSEGDREKDRENVRKALATL